MSDLNLILSVPQGAITATSMGVEGFARHNSPGSGKHFKGRKLFIDLAINNKLPDFEFLNDGGWRDAETDTTKALKAAASGKHTKTALSNNAFSCTPINAYKQIYLVKTAGKVMALEQGQALHKFKTHNCHEEMSLAEVATAAGCPERKERTTHLYLVMSPIQLLIVSSLTPAEYAWYATHRPGKVFRQLLFAEVQPNQSGLAAESRFTNARHEIDTLPDKKTKTIVSGDCINKVRFQTWLGYENSTEGGLYVANHKQINVWHFPKEIPVNWDRSHG